MGYATKQNSQKIKHKWLRTFKRKCSSSLAVKEKQIKTTLTFHLAQFSMVKINKINENSCWRECRGKEKPHPFLMRVQTCTASMEISVAVLKEAGNRQDLYIKIVIHSGAYTQRILHSSPEIFALPCLFLFYSLRNEKEYRCPPIDEWMIKMWHTQWNIIWMLRKLKL